MCFMEQFCSVLQQINLMLRHLRCAGTQALSLTASNVKRDCTDAIIQQFSQQLAASHTWIAHSEIESVAHRIVHILVVHNFKTILRKNILSLFCTTAIFKNIVTEIVGAIVCGLQIAVNAYWAENAVPEVKEYTAP